MRSNTAAISATNSAMNADGDIFKQLKTISKDTWDETTSKESIKNIVIAAAAGGLATGLTNFVNGGSFNTPAATKTISANATWKQRIGTSLTNSFKEVATQTVASTAAQSAINGDSFTNALKAQGKNILIYTAAKVLANQVGRARHGSQMNEVNQDAWQNDNGHFEQVAGMSASESQAAVNATGIGKPLQLTLHAGLGCGIASAAGGNCGSGAIAGVIGEQVAETGNRYGGFNQQTSIQLANAFGAISAGAYGNLTNQSDEH